MVNKSQMVTNNTKLIYGLSGKTVA